MKAHWKGNVKQTFPFLAEDDHQLAETIRCVLRPFCGAHIRTSVHRICSCCIYAYIQCIFTYTRKTDWRACNGLAGSSHLTHHAPAVSAFHCPEKRCGQRSAAATATAAPGCCAYCTIYTVKKIYRQCWPTDRSCISGVQSFLPPYGRSEYTEC